MVLEYVLEYAHVYVPYHGRYVVYVYYIHVHTRVPMVHVYTFTMVPMVPWYVPRYTCTMVRTGVPLWYDGTPYHGTRVPVVPMVHMYHGRF